MALIDAYLSSFVLVVVISMFVLLLLRYLKQPSIIGYILVGVLIGPSFLGLIKNGDLISNLGNFGIVLLLFFVGMEVKFDSLIKRWKVALFGTIFQVVISIIAMISLGYFLDWTFQKVVLFGFIISLSSTAVVIKVLEMKKILDKEIGHEILGILLIQDLAVVPMIIGISFLNNDLDLSSIILQIVGLFLMLVFVWFIFRKKETHLFFHNAISKDHDLQIILSFALCFGFAFITSIFGLSTALGAFIAGVYISRIKETHWAHERLLSIKIIFLAMFFISIGLLIDIDFLIENIGLITLLTTFVLLINTFANALIFRGFGRTWSYSIFAGSLLSQIGEFSFLLSAIGYKSGILTDIGYQTTIAVISLSLLISPIWIEIFSWIGKKTYPFEKSK